MWGMKEMEESGMNHEAEEPYKEREEKKWEWVQVKRTYT